MHVLAATMLCAAIALLLFGAYSFMTAFGIVRVKLPAIFTDYSKSYAVDSYIWDELIPATARRRYFMYTTSITVGAAFLAGFVFCVGNSVAALCFALVSILGAAHTLRRWFQYRDRL